VLGQLRFDGGVQITPLLRILQVGHTQASQPESLTIGGFGWDIKLDRAVEARYLDFTPQQQAEQIDRNRRSEVIPLPLRPVP
jgi:hypothetical protein